jgi:hypothetical protein
MQFVAIEVACRSCQGRGLETVLATWAAQTESPEFDPREVHARGDNLAVLIQELPVTADGVRRRFKMLCPRCGAKPVVREDKIDEALAAIYEHGAVGKTRRVFL